MGKRGPAAQPTRLKLLKGNPGKRPLNDSEPQPDAVPRDLQPPDWIQGDEFALAEWRRVFPQLQKLGLVTVLDVTSLAALCRQYSAWRRLDAEVRESGGVVTVTGPKGGIKGVFASPKVKMADAAFDRWAKLCREFGLTPSSRSGLKVEKPKQRPLDAYRKGAG